MFKWEFGRQNSGYLKMKIFQNKNFDIFLLKFPEGCHVPEHKDPIEGKSHYRINLTLIKPKNGGNFIGGNPILNFNRLIFFRPDKYIHSMSKINKGNCLMLSIGFAI